MGTRAPVVDHGPRTGARVALTFDADMTDAMSASLRGRAGCSRTRTCAILDLLERERVPATFFLTGKWVERVPGRDPADCAANPRFELANHTYGHAAFTADCYRPAAGCPGRRAGRRRGADVRGDRAVRRVGRPGTSGFPGLCHDADGAGPRWRRWA